MEWNPRSMISALIASLLFPAGLFAADSPSPKLALSFRPTQKDVEIDRPKEADIGKCKVQVERKGKASGWVVIGSNGQTLRRFIDTNGDNIVDQWRYYHHGIEVYRDVDSNFNNKVDRCRWLNTGGSRWGVDSNEDGRIDTWKVISAEEVSREAVRALASGNANVLSRVLISADDLKSLGITAEYRRKILDSVASPADKLRSALSKTPVSPKTTWVRFNATQPGTIPADEGKATSDLTVYENAMAIVDTGGKPGLVQIGELIQVGKTWKLTQIPQPVGDNTQVAAGGLLMQPHLAAASAAATTAGNVTPEIQKLLGDLQKIDQSAPQPNAGPRAFAVYNAKRAALLKKLIAASKSDKDRAQWRRQMIDGIAAAVQSGASSGGLKELQTLESRIRRENARSELVPYVTFRRMLAEYTVKLQSAGSAKDRASVQTWWLQQLESFAKTWSKSEDAPEAMSQLATALEFNGRLKEARKWYGLAATFENSSTAGQRAAGALRRLDLEGQVLKLSGKGLAGGSIDVSRYRGKVVLVIFWSSWCKPCTEDLPAIKELSRKFQVAGFEIVGVNLDISTTAAKAYIAKYGNSWAHLYEDGGLDSPAARRFGIISLPTMFLVDRNGKVVSRNATVDTVTKALPGLLKAK